MARLRKRPYLADLLQNGVDAFTLLPSMLGEMLDNPLMIKTWDDFEAKARGK